jgi:hypothetical protein
MELPRRYVQHVGPGDALLWVAAEHVDSGAPGPSTLIFAGRQEPSLDSTPIPPRQTVEGKQRAQLGDRGECARCRNGDLESIFR